MKTATAYKWALRMALTQFFGLGLVVLAVAQNSPAPKQREPAKQPEQTRNAGRMQSQDAHFAACLILGSQNEIVIAKMAEQRSQSPEVKEFAQMIQKDHQQCITNLEKIAGNLTPNRRPAKESAGETRRDSRTEDAGNGRTIAKDAKRTEPEPKKDGREQVHAGAAEMPKEMHFQIHQEIADECLSSTQRELASKKGREFDACFIGMQIAAHMYLIDEMKVFERHASPELQSVLETGLKETEEHLAQAKAIMKDLEKGATRETSEK